MSSNRIISNCRNSLCSSHHRYSLPPSGSLTPSVDDKRSTKALTKFGQTLEINLLDHNIISSKGHSCLKSLHNGLFIDGL
ncbi:JAB domain-containing protein [Sessilibacter corallicola]|uniref:JAB domain-containing protein n=1 Tax=Sessilibacter corallicola TaxID=2904075 RepID=UPI00333E9FB8